MSILIAGNAEHLHRRWILYEQTNRLLDWFFCIEALAWKRIEDHYQGPLPEKLFLVQGQTLTSEFAISHRRRQVNGCDITIEVGAQIPFSVTRVRRVTAVQGFEHREIQCDDHPMWSIFLETFDSFRLSFFSLKRVTGAKKERVEQILRY